MCTTILPDLTAFVAAVLFAVHPIHTEAVSVTQIYIIDSQLAVASHLTRNVLMYKVGVSLLKELKI